MGASRAGLGCELCFDEVFAPVGVDEYLSVTEELEVDRGACGVLDGVVSGFDAADVDCLVADCLGVHFVSLSLWLAYVYHYTPPGEKCKLFPHIFPTVINPLHFNT